MAQAKSRDRATEALPVGCRATGVVYVVPGSREDPRDGVSIRYLRVPGLIALLDGYHYRAF